MQITATPKPVKYFDVGSYGAVGDALTDDSVAFQHAINDAERFQIGNGNIATAVIYVPTGWYRGPNQGPMALTIGAIAPAVTLTFIGEPQDGSSNASFGTPAARITATWTIVGAGGVGIVQPALTFKGLWLDGAINATTFDPGYLSTLNFTSCHIHPPQATQFLNTGSGPAVVRFTGCTFDLTSSVGAIQAIRVVGPGPGGQTPLASLSITGGFVMGNQRLCTGAGAILSIVGTTWLAAAGGVVQGIDLTAAAAGSVVCGNAMPAAPITGNVGANAVAVVGNVTSGITATGAGLVLRGNPGVADSGGSSAAPGFPLTAAGDEGFQPNGVASNALDLHNNAGAVNGIMVTGTATGASAILSPTATGDAAAGIVVTGRGNTTASRHQSLASGAAVPGLEIKLAAAASAHALDVSSSTGTGDLAFIDSTGALTVAQTLTVSAGGITLPTGTGAAAGPGVYDGGQTAGVVLEVVGVAAAVNHVKALNAAHFGTPMVAAVGTDAAIALTLQGKGSGQGVQASNTANVNPWVAAANLVSGFYSYLATDSGGGFFSDAVAGDADIVTSAQTHLVRLGAQGQGSTLRIATVASQVNGIRVTGSATAGLPSIAADGTDALINIGLRAKGSTAGVQITNAADANPYLLVGATSLAQYAFFGLDTTGGTWLTDAAANDSVLTSVGGIFRIGSRTGAVTGSTLRIASVASQVNGLLVTGGATTGNVSLAADGTDAAIGLVVTAKGNTKGLSVKNSTDSNPLLLVGNAAATHYIVMALDTTGGLWLTDDAVNDVVVAVQGGTLRLGTFAGPSKIAVNSTGLGFYGHAPVAQPAAPVTLADVIAVIRGCGLSA